MRISYKILGVIFILLLILGISLTFFIHNKNKQEALFVEAATAQSQNSISALISISSSQQGIAVKDYSYWNEMCSFVKNKDKKWAAENLATVIETYQVDAIWVVNNSFSIVYNHSAKGFYNPEIINNSLSLLPELKKQKLLSTFFVVNDTIFEIFGATIHPTNDPMRLTPSQGFLFVCKKWDHNYLSKLEEISGLKIRISKTAQIPHIDNDSIRFYHELKDCYGDVVTYIEVLRNSPYIQLNRSYSKTLLITFILTAILILLVVFYSLIGWLGKPLSFIEDILKGKTHKIARLKKVGGEYNHIAQLIENSETIKQELKIAKEKAVESDKLKTVFLQNMSHEFRSPLNAIMGFAQLIDNANNNPQKLHEFAEIIYRRGSDLLLLIEEILIVSRVQAGKMPIKYERFKPSVLIKEFENNFNEMKLRLNKDDVGFILRCNCPDDFYLYSDRVKINHIISNLIHNAMKFTESGHIELGCSNQPDGSVTFYVADTGIGIDEDKLVTIFDRFIQIDDNFTGKYEGTGLGLSIVKSFVELLNGKVTVESVVNQGTKFTVTIPENK
jgi:signal transduction histidine kinase